MKSVQPDEFPPGGLSLLPTRRVIWGTGSLGRLGGLLEDFDTERVLVVTSRSLAQQSALLSRVRTQCGARYGGQFAAVPAHVPQTAVEDTAVAARTARADTLVCFGGGSVIDAGKAVAVSLARDRGGPPPRLIALPTTLSGAEFADHYGVTENRDGASVKLTHGREDVTPAAVILDAELTQATPQWLWAGSAFKALDHAVEGLICSAARPVLDELAREGIRQLVMSLPRSLDPTAVDARQACQIAAWYCYFAPASLTLGLSHRIGHVLGGTYGVPHAFTSALTLPTVLAAAGPLAPGRLDLLTQALEQAGAQDQRADVSEDSPAVLSRLAREAGLPTRLREVNVQRGDLKAIADQVLARYPEALRQLEGSGVQLHGLLQAIW